MRVLLESGKFVLVTSYDERFKARATGCKWDDDRRRWEVKVNLLSAAQIVSQAKPGDDVEVARAYIRGWDEPCPLVVPSTKEPEMPHQVQGTSRIIHRKRFFLTFDMGCGKTLSVIGAAQELFKDGEIDLLLVVVPLSVFGSWERQMARFCNVPYRIVHLTGDRKKRIARMEDVKTLRASFRQKRLIVGLVNYEALRLFADDLIKMKPGLVAFDESTFIKNRVAKMTKAAVRISRAAKYATALTGTPISNNVGDLFAQLNAVSSEFVGDNYSNFVHTFARFGGFKGKEIVGIQNEKGLDWILKRVSLRVRKEEVLQLPERTWETREVTLEDDQKDAYEKAEKEFYFAVAAVKKEIASGAEKDPERRKHLVTVLIKSALARLLRCQQIASGHCRDEAGETILWPENPKLKEIVRLAEESGDQRIVIFSRFVEDLIQGQKALEAAGFRAEAFHGKVKHEKRAEIENEFLKDSTSLKVVLAQVKTGGFGIDFSRASICTFMTNWFSWAVRDQAESRLHRLGQKRNVSNIDLIAKGTVDELVLEMVLSKKSLSEVLFGRKIAEADDEAEKSLVGTDFEVVA
jgi:SNF2 family DNA or RNA helicase